MTGVTAYQALHAALLWHIDAGADAPLGDDAVDRLVAMPHSENTPQRASMADPAPVPQSVAADLLPGPLGASEARAEALALALAADTLEALCAAIAGFAGIGLKDTATNMVFGDGHSGAQIMVIGDAPGADDDREGRPFAGTEGVLMDRILASIGLARDATDPLQAVYMTTLLNWRPPGNRSPNPAEISISLPFIERHIQLVRPKLLILAGQIAAQSLLGSSEGISRQRGRWASYTPRTTALHGADMVAIPAMATFPPAYLIKNQAQKRLVWHDMLDILEKRKRLGLP